MDIEKFIKKRDIIKEIKDNTISKLLYDNMKEYAIEVSENRALASYKDGMKPSSRRIIKALIDMGAYNNKATIKSAKVVGDTMGKYHPHGDSGIASALATLVNSKYPIVFGQGNWGSLTDSPASTRYTECRISDFGMKFIECFEVADMIPNYSGEYTEPVDFPTRVPYFFLNGTDGIAVGLSCKTPDHNLSEVIDAFVYVIKNGDSSTIDGLFEYLKGPDYKYGGKIISTLDEVKSVYASGQGTIKYECDYVIDENGDDYILTINGYCPKFNPGTFLTQLTSLIENKEVTYANDSSTKDEPCKIEVIFKNMDVFNNKLLKLLRTTVSYQFYALERTISNDPTRDVDTKILDTDFLSLMKLWINYRREVEYRMLNKDIISLKNKIYKINCRKEAASNMNVIKNCLEVNDSIAYLNKNLQFLIETPSVNGIKGAEYITNLKLNTLKKMSIPEMTKEINNLSNEINNIEEKIKDIDSVIIEKLNDLKPHSEIRKTKVK